MLGVSYFRIALKKWSHDTELVLPGTAGELSSWKACLAARGPVARAVNSFRYGTKRAGGSMSPAECRNLYKVT